MKLDARRRSAKVAVGVRIALQKNVLYLHAPAGIGRSKLAVSVERRLGVPATGRNWRMVCRVLKIAGECV